MGVVLFIFTLLFYNVHSQIYGPGSPYLQQQGLNISPAPNTPNTLDIFSPSGPINIVSNQNTANPKSTINSAQSVSPASQTTTTSLNIPNILPNNFPNNQAYVNTPSVIQNQQTFLPPLAINQIPGINIPTTISPVSTISIPTTSIPTSSINIPNTIINPTPCNSPIQSQTIFNSNPPAFSNVPQLAPSIIQNNVPSCNSQPTVTTVIDNTLANSLANAIQLLIVSNLIENSLGAVPNNCGSVNFLPNVPVNNFEIVTPDFTGSNYDYPTVSYSDPVYNIPDPVYSIPDPVYSIPDPVYSIPEPVYSIPDPVYSIPEQVYSVPSAVYSVPDPVYTVSEPIFQTSVDYTSNVPIPNYSLIEPNYGPNQVVLDTSPQYIPQFTSNNIGYEVPMAACVPPMAFEVPFPSSIPAQLTCNFGILPSNQPCVSFNVEPLPCSNMQIFGNCGL